MLFKQYTDKKNPVSLCISSFSHGTVSEYHVMLQITDCSLTYQQQLSAILAAYDSMVETDLNGAVTVMKRFFLSDAANQSDLLWASVMENSDCAVSVVEQPPLDGSKIAMWACLQTNVMTQVLSGGLYMVQHDAYCHYWLGTSVNRALNSEYQTKLLLNDYVMRLAEQGMSLANNCIRTWFFVQNVDVNYTGVVKGRNEVFASQNLTEHTHYIASTGIAGRHADPKVAVQMDAYAVKGLQTEQIQFLYAPEYLNPTYEYGVSFERGTCVKYGDRRHVFISGTASINNKGEVMYQGDIERQTQRMWDNVQALLEEAECSFEDVAHMIVYLRDMADYKTVKGLYSLRFPHIPTIFVWAPVCRPGWLIEMECMAVRKDDNPQWQAF